ncbi:unnamed protein product [Closterium sp. Naga37s-1]|nr:unnamed protein product [Closterium sp. Naga37s-1]
MELIMSRAKGPVYATKAAAYDEEERDEPQVNDELVAKAGAQKAIVETYRQENERRSAGLKDFLPNPCSKGQFACSGDHAALARQARVVQRSINATQVKRDGECIGIGKLCIVGWADISDEELEGDELGDLSPDDVVPTSAHRRVHDENQVQEELY